MYAFRAGGATLTVETQKLQQRVCGIVRAHTVGSTNDVGRLMEQRFRCTVLLYCVTPNACGVCCMAAIQGTLSLNAAIFAAVLLASRLESNEKVFGLVLFALELFAFFPLAR